MASPDKPTQPADYRYLGRSRKLVEGRDKVSGRARYAADVTLPGMLHLCPVSSPHAHAEIKAIDGREAERIAEVVAVLTAEDLPSRERVITSRSSAVLAKGKVLFVGQPVAVVVGRAKQRPRMVPSGCGWTTGPCPP